MNTNLKTGIYIRVSTEDQAKDGFSIPAQKEKLTKYSEINDWNIYDYYIDDGISGKNIKDRSEVNRLIKDIKDGKVDNVLVYKLDRITRSLKDLIYLIELFESYSCTFNSQTEKIDTSNAVGRMFVKIIGIFAEFERENLAERVAFGYEQKTREGNYTNTNGVYGYDYIVGEQRLVVNEAEKELVNMIYDMYIDGMSYDKIANKFNKDGVPTKRGGHWASSTIKSILNNPLYIGKVRYGTQNKEKSFVAKGKNIPSIIDIDKWNLANSIVKTRKKYCIRRYPSDNSYYFHTIKCARCGGNISARQQVQYGKLYITYKCNNASRHFCDMKGFSHKKVDKSFLTFLDTLKDMIPEKSIIEDDKRIRNKTIEKQKIINKIEKLESKKKIIRNQFIEDSISIEEYREITNEIEEKISNLNDSLLLIGTEEESNDNFSYDEVKDLVKNIKQNWLFLNNKEKRQFLERFVEEIKVDKIGEDVLIKDVKFKRYSYE